MSTEQGLVSSLRILKFPPNSETQSLLLHVRTSSPEKSNISESVCLPLDRDQAKGQLILANLKVTSLGTTFSEPKIF